MEHSVIVSQWIVRVIDGRAPPASSVVIALDAGHVESELLPGPTTWPFFVEGQQSRDSGDGEGGFFPENPPSLGNESL